jgi:hypothetical protein
MESRMYVHSHNSDCNVVYEFKDSDGDQFIIEALDDENEVTEALGATMVVHVRQNSAGNSEPTEASVYMSEEQLKAMLIALRGTPTSPAEIERFLDA